jgi:hypothetical protein
VYKLAKARQRSRQDKMDVSMIKDKNSNILVDEQAIQDTWKEYFEVLLNVENAREQLEETAPEEGPEREIRSHPFMTLTNFRLFNPSYPLSTAIHNSMNPDPPCGRPHSGDST